MKKIFEFLTYFTICAFFILLLLDFLIPALLSLGLGWGFCYIGYNIKN